LNSDEYRRAEAQLEEALAIFVEREAQFATLVGDVRNNIAKVRADIAALREQREKQGLDLKR
jgi:predicted fused transcriptional regulator/phosphomethylpyrimidine kinase